MKINQKMSIVAAVTGLNAVDSPGPGVAVIRALRDCPDFEVRIVGLSYEALEPGIYMEGLCDVVYQIPYPSSGSETLLSRMQYIQEMEGINVVIPNFDAELFGFIKIAPALLEIGITSLLPTLAQLDARDKSHLSEFGQQHGFYVPRDQILYSIHSLPSAAESLQYPLVVKGKYYEAVVAHTLEQAQKAFYKMQAKWGLPIIVQEFIQGTEVNVAALGDGEGNLISAIPMRKMFITDKGKAWAGITLEDDGLIALAQKFVAVTQWRGGCELEIMRTADGRPYIMEVNPRFPAWIYLSVGAGQNQPAALVKMALGEKVQPMTEYATGKMFIRYSWDIIADVGTFQQISGNGEL
jgi:carbamoyl-phosphate synthase large subunit